MKIWFLQFTFTTRYNSIRKNVFGQNKFAKIYLGGRHLIELCVHVCMCTIELNSQIELWMGWTFMFFFFFLWGHGLVCYIFAIMCGKIWIGTNVFFVRGEGELQFLFVFDQTLWTGRLFFLYPAFYIYGNYKKNI